MHAVTAQQLERIGQTIALRLIEVSGVDVSSVALDMTNFATFITTANAKAPIAQRGKAKQKRSDLRLVGLGLVVTRDGGIPLTWHAYPGDKPDVTQFPAMIDQLRRRYEAITAAAGRTSGSAEMTVVFDAGQNSADNFAHLAGSGLHYIGSVPISDCPDLVLRVTQDDDDGVIRFDDDPMMRTAPLGVVSGAVVGVVTGCPSG